MHSLTALAWRNLGQSRARTVLGALAISLGVAMVVATSVLTSGMRAAWEGGQNRMSFITDLSDEVFTMVGVMLLLASGFLIYNAFAMSMARQRQQIGMLRALGMERRQVLRLVLLEALFTSGAGVLLGLAGGPLLGRGLLKGLSQMGMDVGRGTVSPVSLVLGVGMGLGISMLSALLPARQAASTSPMSTLRDNINPEDFTQSYDRRKPGRRVRLMAGLVILSALLIYLLIAPPGEWSGYHPPWDYGMVFLLWAVWLSGLWLVLPTLILFMIDLVSLGLPCLAGTVGRLAAGNLRRSPWRVTLTALTFAVGLMIMITTGGYISFGNDVMVKTLAMNALNEAAWYVYPFDHSTGLGQLSGFDANAPSLEASLVQEIYQRSSGRARVDEIYIVQVPEISSPFPGFASFIYTDLDHLSRPGAYRLVEGDWETILPLLRGPGCSVLITPAVAARNSVALGEQLTVTGRNGQVTCTVAGLGAGGISAVSLINPPARDNFTRPGQTPDGLIIRPLPSEDSANLGAGLSALCQRYPGQAYLSRPLDEYRAITNTSDQLMVMFDGLVSLGLIGACLGMVNTTLMSVLERRKELGLLRAVGATRRQVTAVLLLEAAVIAAFGALLGILIGLGMVVLYVLGYGAVTFGLGNLSLWWAAGQVIIPALRAGWWVALAAPLLAALAAYPVTRSVLRGGVVEALERE